MTQNRDEEKSPTAPADIRQERAHQCLYYLRLFAAAVVVALALVAYVWQQPLPQNAIPILEYHMVATYTDDTSYEYNVPPAEFRRQMEWLKENGYTTVTLLDIMKAKKGKLTLPEKPIVLTFDDGYDNNYFELLPILREYGFKATVFMVTNNIGTEGYMTWDDLRILQNEGIEIASHTANHLPLTKVKPEKYDDEILLSKLLLEWNGIKTVFFLSYPNGQYNINLLQYLRGSEFLGAVTGDTRLLVPDKDDPFLLPRINIAHPRFGITEFRWRLTKAEFFTKLKNLGR